MSKAWKIIIGVGSSLLAAALIVVTVLFFPLNGKKHVEIWSAGDEFDIADVVSIEKKPGEEFKVLQFTDTQLWSGIGDNNATFDLMKELVEREKPDLIVTVGDNVSGASSRFLLKQFIKVMDSFKVPWAPVFGNHDNEIPTTTLNWQGDKFEESEYCVFKKGPSNLYGCGNYVINIVENSKAVQSLFMFDNGRYIEYDNGDKKEVYMGYEQMAWYKWNVQGIASSMGETVPSMTFSHFAPPEFRTAVETYGALNEKDGSYTIPEEYGVGKMQYLPGVSPVNSGFFDLCKELGSTKYIFCGHDHENYGSVIYDGITMTYGLKTGPSPEPWNDAEFYGGTTITIGNEDTQYGVTIENILQQ